DRKPRAPSSRANYCGEPASSLEGMTMSFIRNVFVAGAIAFGSMTGLANAQEFITVASTTSTEQSGLFGHILPIFQEKTGIEVRVIAQGTGQALDTGRRGDA